MPHPDRLHRRAISEWRATVIVRETACLAREHRAIADEELVGTPARLARLEGWSEARLRSAA